MRAQSSFPREKFPSTHQRIARLFFGDDSTKKTPDQLMRELRLLLNNAKDLDEPIEMTLLKVGLCRQIDEAQRRQRSLEVKDAKHLQPNNSLALHIHREVVNHRRAQLAVSTAQVNTLDRVLARVNARASAVDAAASAASPCESAPVASSSPRTQ